MHSRFDNLHLAFHREFLMHSGCCLAASSFPEQPAVRKIANPTADQRLASGLNLVSVFMIWDIIGLSVVNLTVITEWHI